MSAGSLGRVENSAASGKVRKLPKAGAGLTSRNPVIYRRRKSFSTLQVDVH
jgi:hypothetical protein